MSCLAGYGYKKEITIDSTKIDSTLTDFPVLVHLSASNFDFSKVQDNLNDIRFTLANGTELDFEIDEIQTDENTYFSSFITGGTASASSGSNVGKAWDGIDDGAHWGSGNFALPGAWTKYDLGSGVTKTARRLDLKPHHNGSGGFVKNFTLEGSNNDSDWDILLTDVHNDSLDVASYEFENSTAYRYYRIVVEDNWRADTETAIEEIELFEIDSEFTTPTDAYIWVRVPSVSSSIDTSIFIVYGNPSATNGENKTGVWDSNHKGVWHLGENGFAKVDGYKDSTSNANHGESEGNTAKISSGKIGSAQDFVTSRIVVPDSASLEPGSQDLTWSFKLFFDVTTGNQCFIGRRTSGGSYFYFARESTGIRFRDYTGANVIDFSTSWSPTGSVWLDVEVVRNGSNFEVFVDNVSVLTGSDADAFTNRTGDWTFGSQPDISYHVNGKMDEIRMSVGIDRGSAWRKARINGDNETLVSYGSEESCATDNAVFFGNAF